MRKWLLDLRKGRTQAEVAKAAGISQQMYSAIERGERWPSVKVAKRLAAVLGFDWTRLYEDDEDNDE